MTHDPFCPDGFSIEHCCDVVAEIRADERAAAMRDAVEAVPHINCAIFIPGQHCDCQRPIIIAAIEALGGER